MNKIMFYSLHFYPHLTLLFISVIFTFILVLSSVSLVCHLVWSLIYLTCKAGRIIEKWSFI